MVAAASFKVGSQSRRGEEREERKEREEGRKERQERERRKNKGGWKEAYTHTQKKIHFSADTLQTSSGTISILCVQHWQAQKTTVCLPAQPRPQSQLHSLAGTKHPSTNTQKYPLPRLGTKYPEKLIGPLCHLLC